MRSNQLSYAALLSGCGGRIRTGNLRVMSPTSFLIAPPRGVFCRERESNPHEVTLQRILSPLRLPIPPSRRICQLPGYYVCLVIAVLMLLERERRFELPTSALARQRSTAELFPRFSHYCHHGFSQETQQWQHCLFQIPLPL